MHIGLIGRTHLLLETARRILADGSGDTIAFIYTTRAADYAEADEAAFEAFATEHGIPFFCDNAIVSRAGELSADVCLSINWLTVLPQSFLDQFAHGVFNAHAGDLPRYRGNATMNWAILNGEPEACLTIHQMVEELDAGPIALQRRRPIGTDTDITELYGWLDEQVPDAFLAVLGRIRSGQLSLVEQDPAIRPLRAYPRKPDDARIDWRRPTDEILRVVRASSRPFAGAFAFTEDGRRVTIFRARNYEPDHDALAVPGQVCLVADGNPVIATLDGMVELLECDDNETTKLIAASLRNRLV